MNSPFDIDLSKKTDDQLDGYITNWIARGYRVEAQKPLLEKVKRGTATRKQLALFEWNEDRADIELRRFVEISESVPDNRKATRATGGKRIAGEYWVDRYTGIRNERVHAYFACHIEKAGSSPVFELKDFRGETKIFTYDSLDMAFDLWRALGIQAGASSADVP